MVGQTLGNYRIVAKLGNGAMGQVFLAEHQRIVRRVAIKVLNQDLTTNPRSVARFLDEARATSLIRHPGIVEVFDCDVDPSGRVYLVMEYLEGKTLASRLQEQHRLPWPMACQVTRQMAVALGAAHEKGIIHRDIKPENVFLSVAADRPQELVVRVLDFGIAKLLSGDPVDGARTIPGMLVGTPDYMAPEQCGGTEPVDQRADIYALGCVLFRMVSGRLPFIASNFRDVMAAHMFRMPPPLGPVDPPTPRWLNDLVGRMLAKEPSERPASMDEVAHSLARAGESTSASGAPQTSIELSNDVSGAKVSAAALPGLPVRLKHIFSRGWWPAALVGAGCAVLGIVGVLWFGTGPRRSVARSVISAPTESDRPLPSPQQQQPPPAPAPVPTVIAPLADLAAADASVDRSGAAAAPAGAQALPSSRARAPSAGTRPPARREPGRRPAHKVEMDGLVDL